MKPEYLKEATKLHADLTELKAQHTALSDTKELDVRFFSRQVSITSDEHNYDKVKSALMTLLDLRMKNIYCRANQIGLDLQPVVIPEPVAVR